MNMIIRNNLAKFVKMQLELPLTLNYIVIYTQEPYGRIYTISENLFIG